jgi:DNA mismatch repair protein MutL
MEPVLVHVSEEELNRFINHKLLFEKLGYDAEIFGDDTLIVRSVPYIFNKAIDPGEFTVILDQLSDQYLDSQMGLLLEEMASMSCKAAVKANDKMTEIECHRLIDELLALENPFNCPHGRPTIIAMTKYELEKKFKRIV